MLVSTPSKSSPFVSVINQYGQPLMPCSPRKARLLLKEGKAKVLKKSPFQIKLLYGSSGYRQPMVAGLDTGTKTLGSAVVANNQVVYQAEVQLRTDISKKMEVRRNYRRTRRGRKNRHREARALNRASMRRKGRLSPTLQSQLQSHLREIRQVEKLFPITQWRIETAAFDIHKLHRPEVEGKGYQEGPQKGYYNTKAYVLHRDGYRCQSKQKGKHSPKLHVHHLQPRSQGGTNAPDNLLTLCESCHKALHKGEFVLKKARKTSRKAPTQMGVLRSLIRKLDMDFVETYGYETKYKRETFLGLPKTHAFDAVAIATGDGQQPTFLEHVWYKRHVANGDYQQTKGKRSEKTIPTGKVFGLRKFDLIATSKGTGFVKGKRSSGYFVLMDIHGKTISTSVNIKKDMRRLVARSTTLLHGAFLPPLKKGVSSPSQPKG